MVVLRIFNTDQTLYWTAHFNSKKECDAWLAEEQTRPYWKIGFTVDIEDNTAEEEAKIALAQAAIDQKNIEKSLAVEELLLLKAKSSLSQEESARALNLILTYLEIK